jgi:hypothetical protein
VILVLAFTGVKIGYNRLEEAMLESAPSPEITATRLEEKKTPIMHQADDYRIIINRNIFGAALDRKTETAVTVPVEELQPTKLKLSLMGTVSGDEENSRAIIEDETNRKQDIYEVGDTIQGALIKAIERRRVVLQVSGNDEVLNIKEREGGPPESRFTAASRTAPRRALQERLTVRRPSVRPLANRPRPVVRTPVPAGGPEDEFQDEQFDEEFNEEFGDEEDDEFDDTAMEDEEFFDEPVMDEEPPVEPPLPDEEPY